MYFLATCDTNCRHVVYATRPTLDGRKCMASGCRGVYRHIRAGGVPRPYKKRQTTVFDGKVKEIIEARLYTERSLRDRGRLAERGRVRSRDDSPVRGDRDRSRSPVRHYADDDDEDDEASASFVADDDADDPDYIGDPARFLGIYSRLSVIGLNYAERPGLDGIAAACPPQQLRSVMAQVGAPVKNGGQHGAMGVDAATASQRNLPTTTLSGPGGAPIAAPASEEWCHLLAACLGGHAIAGNLVAGSHACNTFMLAIEMALKGNAQFWVEVTAYCRPDARIAEAIRYKVGKLSTAGTKVLLNILIDATAQHFSRADLDRLVLQLKAALK